MLSRRPQPTRLPTVPAAMLRAPSAWATAPSAKQQRQVVLRRAGWTLLAILSVLAVAGLLASMPVLLVRTLSSTSTTGWLALGVVACSAALWAGAVYRRQTRG